MMIMNFIKKSIIIILLMCLGVSSANAQLSTTLFGIKNAPVEKFEGGMSGCLMKNEKQGRQSSAIQQLDYEEVLRLSDLMKEERKYRNRSTLYGVFGGLSLGLGILCTTCGILAFAGNEHGNTAVDFGGIILTGAGGIFTLGSVPLFIACHRQKVKAVEISASIKPLVTPGLPSTPGVGFTVNF